jgi:hypothetical protein
VGVELVNHWLFGIKCKGTLGEACFANGHAGGVTPVDYLGLDSVGWSWVIGHRQPVVLVRWVEMFLGERCDPFKGARDDSWVANTYISLAW